MIAGMVAVQVLLLTQGACVDGTVVSCTLAGCAKAQRECVMGFFTPCECIAPVTCDDFNPCTDDTFDGTQCVFTPRPGRSCSDGNPCTGPDTCNSSGACMGPVMVGASCADGDFCNGPETCDASGACVPGPPPKLNDQVQLTYDYCDPGAQAVSHESIPGGGGTVPTAEAFASPIVAANPLAQPMPSAPGLGAPYVVENTGEARYRYDFQLPGARGRFQPGLALEYRSGQRENRGYGIGWSLTTAFVEADISPTPRAPYDTLRNRYWVSLGDDRKLLVCADEAGLQRCRPEFSDQYFEISYTPPAAGWGGWWSGVDAVGNSYTFAAAFQGPGGQGGRWYLSSVKDVDGNEAVLAYVVDDGASALLSSIQYNKYGSLYATQVQLYYSAMAPARTELVAGAMARGDLVLRTLRVQNRGAAGYVTLLRHEIAYQNAAYTRAPLLSSIAVFAGETSQSLQPTTFIYDTPPPYAFQGSVTLPAWDQRLGEWHDLDGDGLVDYVLWGGRYWARNTGPAGGLPTFAPVVELTGAAGFELAGRPGEKAILDFNGDGVPDLLMTGGADGCPYLSVRFGQVSGGTVSYKPVECVDAAEPWNYASATNDVYLPLTTSLFGPRLSLADVNGDGIADYTYDPRGPLYANGDLYDAGLLVFLGYRGPTGWAFAQPVAKLVPGGWAAMAASDYALRDWNGDGLLDWPGPHMEEGRSVSAVLPWPETLSDLVTPRAYPTRWIPPFFRGYVSCPQEYSFKSYSNDPRETVAYVDLNGDGRADRVRKIRPGEPECPEVPCGPDLLNPVPSYCSTVACPLGVDWNTGGGFARGPDLYPPFDMYPEIVEGSPDVWCWCEYFVTGVAVLQPCHGNAVNFPFVGPQHFLDVNGDGVADYVHGNTVELGTSGIELLRAVTTPAGARFDVEYAFGSRFGATPKDGASRVVTSIAMSGPRLSPLSANDSAHNRTRYWYQDPVRAALWYEPLRQEPRGFAKTWVQDDASLIVRATTWATGSHAFSGSPLSVQWGVPTGGAPLPSGAPASQAFRTVSYWYAARAPQNAACVDVAGEPLASSYPVTLVVRSVTQSHTVDGVILSSLRSKGCADVDEFGNTLREFVDPDSSHPGDELYEYAVYDGTATCKSCPVERRVTDTQAQPVQLAQSLFRYDSPAGVGGPTWNQPLFQGLAGKGHLNYVRRWVSSLGATWYEVESATAYNADGTVAYRIVDPIPAAHTYAVKETLTYDAQQLRVVRRTVSDIGSSTGTSLATDATYDDYGRLVLEQGPYLVGTAAQSARAYLRDGFGRVRAVGRGIANGKVTEAIAATEYLDTIPDEVKSYAFLAPLDYTPGDNLQTPNAKQVVTHFDGLGRSVQVRERLGAGGTPAAGAQISQILGGYRVAGTVKLDGAGRVRASLEPFFSGGEAYEEFDAVASGRRASMSWFDVQGRLTCASTGVYGALVADGGACASSFLDDSNHKLGTAFRYRGFVDGRAYVGVEAVPPASGTVRGTEAVYAADGHLAWSADAYGNKVVYGYDLLGRPLSVTRKASGVPKADQTVSRAYDSLGRVVQEFDPNWSYAGGATLYTWDAAGRLVRVQRPAQLVGPTRARAELRYEYKSLGRRTRSYALEPLWTGSGVSLGSRTLATFGYDQPYAGDGVAYGFTAGRLSYAASSVTTIALGYDRNGAATRRDQWFAGLAAPFTVTGQVADDGRLLSSTGSFGAATSVTYASWYDSSGRAARLEAGGTALWEADYAGRAYGAYDALGRLPLVKSNWGLVSTARTYSAYTGQLTAHGVASSAAQVYGVENVVYFGAKVRSMRDTRTGTSYSYAYEGNGRLEAAQAAGGGASGYAQGFSFTDPSWPARATVGNLERATAGGTTTDYDYMSDRVMALSVGAAEVARLRYDHAGRLSSKRTALEVETEGFAYDVLDQLRQVRRSGAVAEELEYDPFGAVLFRKVGTRAYYYAGAHATLTADVSSGCSYASCAPTNVQVGVHVLLGGARVATVRPSDVLYYHRDLRGSVVATTRSGGVVGARYRWGPYGELEWSEGDDGVSGSELGYTGGLRLGWASGSQSGALVLLGARVYDASLRRWLQPDTVELERYSYAGGDPVNLVDPTGREPLASGASPPAASSRAGDTEGPVGATPGTPLPCGTEENPCPLPPVDVPPPPPPYVPRASDFIWNQRPPNVVDLYIRSFAPFASFGGGFRGDNRRFTTNLNATSRMWGRVTVNLQTGAVTGRGKGSSGTSCAGPPCSWAFGAREETADIAMSVTPLPDGMTIVTLSGANPFISNAPDIDLSLTLQVRPGGFLSATLTGDAFPNAEVFAIGAGGARMLLTYQTLGTALTGPALYLPGKNSIWMGSFESHYP